MKMGDPAEALKDLDSCKDKNDFKYSYVKTKVFFKQQNYKSLLIEV